MKRFIETHFNLVLLLSCAVGLFLPGLASLPNVTVVIALAMLMFISCYRLRDGGFASLRWKDILLFYALRYAVLPGVLFAVANAVVPDYAVGVFLLTTLPAGVASPAFASLYGGAVAPAFAVVIISQLLTPFLIPLQFALLGGVAAAPSPSALFVTMVWCIFLPMLVYAFARRHRRSAAFIHAQNKVWSVLLVAFVIAMAIAKQREIILSGHGVLASLAITLLCFITYIAFGWFLPRRRPREERITYACCSSFNNAALGVSLALLHFSPQVILFVAISEIGWATLPVLLSGFLRVFAR